MKQSINKVFVHIDKTFQQINERAKELNKGETFFSRKTDHDPEGKKYEVSKINPLFYEMTEPDHNGTLAVFMFRTTNVYRNTSHEYRDVILKNSELKKVFYNEDGIEVGLTIEPTLEYPTDTCWGYRFRGYRYYIIKDGVETISESRSVIRKIFNNKPIEEPIINIRIDNDVTTFTREILEFKPLYKNVFFVSTDHEDFYIAKDDDDLWKYILDNIITKEWWIKDLGGVEDMLGMILSGRGFNPLQYLYHNYVFSDFLSIEVPFNRDHVGFTNLGIDSDTDISGYDIYYMTK